MSWDDLSDVVLALTKPRGHFPSMARGSFIVDFHDLDSPEKLNDIIEKAQALDVQSPSAIRKILCEMCGLTEDQVHHLFHNFADCGNIHWKCCKESVKVFFSGREADTLLYGH